MVNLSFKKLGLTGLAASALFLAACGEGVTEDSIGQGQEIEIAHVAGDSDLAATSVIEIVLGDVGFDVTTTMVDHPIMWQSVATGETDVTVTGWLPVTHGAYYEEYEEELDHIGTNMEGARLGLAVPEYMDVDSITDLTDEAGQTITGIEAGAGITAATERALEDYDNLEDWNQVTSSTGAMTTELGNAIDDEEEIVVPAWTPHWKFQAYDLKYLEDPEGAFGGEETIEMFARPDFQEEMPEAYNILSNFQWEIEDIETVMLDIQEGADPEEAAQNWIDDNQETVDEWTAEAEEMTAN